CQIHTLSLHDALPISPGRVTLDSATLVASTTRRRPSAAGLRTRACWSTGRSPWSWRTSKSAGPHPSPPPQAGEGAVAPASPAGRGAVAVPPPAGKAAVAVPPLARKRAAALPPPA